MTETNEKYGKHFLFEKLSFALSLALCVGLAEADPMRNVADSLKQQAAIADSARDKEQDQRAFIATAQRKLDNAMTQAAWKAFNSLKKQGVEFERNHDLSGTLDPYCGRPVIKDSRSNGEFIIYARPSCDEVYTKFSPVGGSSYVLSATLVTGGPKRPANGDCTYMAVVEYRCSAIMEPDFEKKVEQDVAADIARKLIKR